MNLLKLLILFTTLSCIKQIDREIDENFPKYNAIILQDDENILLSIGENHVHGEGFYQRGTIVYAQVVAESGNRRIDTFITTRPSEYSKLDFKVSPGDLVSYSISFREENISGTLEVPRGSFRISSVEEVDSLHSTSFGFGYKEYNVSLEKKGDVSVFLGGLRGASADSELFLIGKDPIFVTPLEFSWRSTDLLEKSVLNENDILFKVFVEPAGDLFSLTLYNFSKSLFHFQQTRELQNIASDDPWSITGNPPPDFSNLQGATGVVGYFNKHNIKVE